MGNNCQTNLTPEQLPKEKQAVQGNPGGTPTGATRNPNGPVNEERDRDPRNRPQQLTDREKDPQRKTEDED